MGSLLTNVVSEEWTLVDAVISVIIHSLRYYTCEDLPNKIKFSIFFGCKGPVPHNQRYYVLVRRRPSRESSRHKKR